MNDVCEFMKYKNDEDSQCISPSCDECKIYKALDKQISKKPVISVYDVAFCPICNGSLWQNKDESNYCFRCGQKIEW